MPMVPRQIAKTSIVPPANSGSNETISKRNIAKAGPPAAANAEPVQNRAASSLG